MRRKRIGRLVLGVALACAAALVTAVVFSNSGGAASSSGSAGAPATSTATNGPGGLPDLVVLDMRIQLETGGSCAFTSTNLGVRVVFANVGSGDAGPFVVDVDGARENVGGLAQGAVGSLWFDGYPFSAKVTAMLDADGEVVESDETNNTNTKGLPVPTLPPTCTPTPPGGGGGQPDLVVESLVPRSQTSCAVAAGVDVMVRNAGDGAAGLSLTRLSAGGGGAVGLLTPALAPGVSVKLNSTLTGVPIGDSYIAIADYDNVVGESDENNNSLKASFSVSTVPTCTPSTFLCPTHTVPTGNGCASITPTRTKTPTPTPTDTPTPPSQTPGDADCDDATTSIDAALVLQLDAGLLPDLACGWLADVSGDGETGSEDALLILQLVAGLIEEFPG